MRDLMFSLDIGTSKLAAVAVDTATLENTAEVGAANDSLIPGLPPGRHEQNPERIREIGFALLRELAEKTAPARIAGIAFSGQMHGVLRLGANGKPATNLYTWCDRRAEARLAKLDETAWPTARTGCRLRAGYGGATLAALGPAPGTMALTIADYLAYTLCGVAASEPTHAASWGIFDVPGNRWDSEILTVLGVSESELPPIRPSAGRLGALTAEAARSLGIPAGTPVHSPVGDNQAGYLGVCGTAGDGILLNLGTGGQISLPVKDFPYCEGLETRPLPDGGNLLVGASLCGGRAYALLAGFFAEAVREFGGIAPDAGKIYDTMNRLAAQSAAPPAVDTRFAGTRSEPARRGAITGLGVENFTPGDLARGVAEGMLRELAEMLPPTVRRSAARVYAGGNAVRKNPLMKSLIEAEFQLPCEFAARREEAAAGAALAAIAVGN